MQSSSRLNTLSEKHKCFLALLIVIVVIASFTGFYLITPGIRSFLDYLNVKNLGDGIAIYMAFQGFVFALFISFTYQQGINRQQAIRASLHIEAKSIMNILFLTKPEVSKKVYKEITSLLKNYLEYFLAEGPKKREQLDAEAFQKLFDIISAVKKENTKGNVCDLIYGALQEISTARSQRIVAVKSNLTRGQMLIHEVLGAMLVIGFIFLDMNLLILETIIFSLIIGTYSLLLGIIIDVDDPFEGQWTVDTSVLNNLLEKLKLQ
ncbi:MAG: bestrophin-like domain [Candidatus Helarchaeota archaeon]